MTKIKKAIFETMNSVLSGLGIIFIISPFLLHQWINGDYERYLWIINGPDPYNKFGGSSYQLAMYLSLLLIGIITIAIAFLLRKSLQREAE